MLHQPDHQLIVQVSQRAEVRLAAIGDLHLRDREPSEVPALLEGLAARADLLVVAGDLTENGRVAEATVAGQLLGGIGLPVVAVLGNHDLRGVRRRAFRQAIESEGVRVLDGDSVVIELASGQRIGIAGVAGSGGGFWREEHAVAPYGRAFRAVAVKVRREAERLDAAICALDAPVKVVVTHFAPTATTLGTEPAAKWWMLGNAELGKVIDRHRIDLVVHGHAHLGSPHGRTAGGTPVHNAALPVNGGVVVIRLHSRWDTAWSTPGESVA
ncbi:MAG: metallophosphoesterase [Chloroflexia bacterium]|nr:metallophosphoesterase [Chloroflexia bacterium]